MPPPIPATSKTADTPVGERSVDPGIDALG